MGTTLNYFSLLGISEDASQDELEARYQALSQYLASTNVPPALREWAEKQAKLVDEAYAVLSDPEQRAAAKGAKASAVAKPEPAPAETPAAAGPEPLSTTPSRLSSSPPSSLPSSLPWRSLAIGAIGGLVVLVVVLVTWFGLFGSVGDGNEVTPPTADENGLIPLDTARVAELMKSAQADPTNPETLFELGETFFQAGEWQSSLDWFTKLIEVEPTNVHALTDIGTSQYNLGSTEDAKATWLKAKEIAPDDPQIHYNLGFLYANAEPQDLEAAKSEWSLVLKLAPGSDLAQTVQVHMDGLAAATTTPQATPTPP